MTDRSVTSSMMDNATSLSLVHSSDVSSESDIQVSPTSSLSLIGNRRGDGGTPISYHTQTTNRFFIDDIQEKKILLKKYQQRYLKEKNRYEKLNNIYNTYLLLHYFRSLDDGQLREMGKRPKKIILKSI